MLLEPGGVSRVIVRRLCVVAWLLWAAFRSAAPVAGMPANFGVVEEGAIYRGSQPTAAQIEELQRRGVRTIVKLNTQELSSERAAAARAGMRLLYVPLSARTVGTRQACEEVERAYAAMVDPNNQPVFVHCSHGRDRTGFLVGVFRERAEGWDYAKVKSELEMYGHNAAMHAVFPHIEEALAARAACGR